MERSPNIFGRTYLCSQEDSTGQKSTKAASVVMPRIYLGRTLTQDPQAVVRKRALGKNLKLGNMEQYFPQHTPPQNPVA